MWRIALTAGNRNERAHIIYFAHKKWQFAFLLLHQLQIQQNLLSQSNYKIVQIPIKRFGREKTLRKCENVELKAH